ncbi:hypothetical protein K490DRAFT_65248 [Saccharata proteae CBS 121410]|uniref:Uncharacterized protein n=1 Tax=Saccharata proteae CBS 121410 TaxID=1314787 RepID=A0A9P4HY15_9PEZI|nr:hypothetical protein K490DRAFT_65248 [Saccharata proteae CBS 121410]
MIPLIPITFPSGKRHKYVTFGDISHVKDLEMQSERIERTALLGDGDAGNAAHAEPKSSLFDLDTWLALFFVVAALVTSFISAIDLMYEDTIDDATFSSLELIVNVFLALAIVARAIWLRNKPVKHVFCFCLQLCLLVGYFSVVPSDSPHRKGRIGGFMVYVAVFCWTQVVLAIFLPEAETRPRSWMTA